MKKQFTLTILTSCLLGISSAAFAQNAEIVNPNQALDIGEANTFEKEVTPLLREITLKKSILELRKVERDIEKLNEEALKAQIEREQLLNPGTKPYETGPMGGITFGNNTTAPIPLNVPGGGNGLNASSPTINMPTPSNSSVTVTETITSSTSTPIRILMIYGYSDNLFAKVAAGDQGGFAVKVGDIMPDGRYVKKITSNYVEVSDKEKGKGKSEKLFVSYTPAPKTSNSNSSAPEIFNPNNTPTNPDALKMPQHLQPIPVPQAPFLMRR